MNCFLSCADAQKLALQIQHEQGTRPLIVGWYRCPKYSCPLPDYDQPPIQGATRLPDARVGAIYTARIPGAISPVALASGQLPPGLALAEDGTISGTPTTSASAPFVFSVWQRPGPVARITIVLRVVAAFKDLPKK